MAKRKRITKEDVETAMKEYVASCYQNSIDETAKTILTMKEVEHLDPPGFKKLIAELKIQRRNQIAKRNKLV